MDKNLEQIIAMANGQNLNDFDTATVPANIRAQIDGALESVFMGKSILIWANGGTLANAWNSAMRDLIDQIFQISGPQDIIQYMRIAVFNLRDVWAVKMAQSNERNSFANVSVQKFDDLCVYANSLIASGMNTINDILRGDATGGAEQRPESQQMPAQQHSMEQEYTRNRK